jgi:hypothetical protein
VHFGDYSGENIDVVWNHQPIADYRLVDNQGAVGDYECRGFAS